MLTRVGLCIAVLMLAARVLVSLCIAFCTPAVAQRVGGALAALGASVALWAVLNAGWLR